MKTILSLSLLFLFGLLLTGCGLLELAGVSVIRASDVVVSETRPVSGFNQIEFNTVGKVVISQGANESLTVSGSDNVLPVIETEVRGSTLVIENKPKTTFTGLDQDNMLTFTIVVKDLSNLTLNGAGDIQIGSLASSDLKVTINGAGSLEIGQLLGNELDFSLNGAGSMEATGEATNAEITISGAGNFKGGDLKLQSADVTINGLGNATVWVTGELSGSINGAGSVSYYGSPQTQTSATGIGNFKPLGEK